MPMASTFTNQTVCQPIGREVFGENFLMKILRNNPGTTAGPVGRDERKNTRTSLTYNMAFRFLGYAFKSFVLLPGNTWQTTR